MAIKGTINGRLENTIEKMEVGDEGFTLPWALSFVPNDDKYSVLLYIKYSVSSEKKQTHELYVKRTGRNNNDFEVDLDSVDSNFKWHVGEPCYMGAKEEDIVNIGEVDIF